METLITWVPISGVIGLVVAAFIFAYVRRQPDGTEKMREIATAIQTLDDQPLVRLYEKGWKRFNL